VSNGSTFPKCMHMEITVAVSELSHLHTFAVESITLCFPSHRLSVDTYDQNAFRDMSYIKLHIERRQLLIKENERQRKSKRS
jgi:hypothetical protein